MNKKRTRLSVLSDNDESALGKLAKKQRSLAVDGKPDQTDVNNLTRLFDLYDRHTGGRLRRMVEENRLERALNNKYRELSIDKAESFGFFMPQDLQQFLEKYYPTIWTNQSHARWFLKKFPMFRR